MKAVLAISGVTFLALVATAAFARDWDDFTPRDPVVKQAGHYEWNWDGDDALSLEAPATMHYTPGGSPRIVITGPEDLLARIRVGQGHIRFDRDFDRDWDHVDNDRLQVTVTGVTVHNISVSGSGRATLEKLNLDHLDLAISGSGSLAGDGRSDRLHVAVSGSGRADVTKLAANEADINISGSGTVADAGRSDHLGLNISGSGHGELGQLQVRDAKIRLSGNGTVAIGRGLEQLDLTLSGGAHVDLGTLQARETRIQMSGSGQVNGSGSSDRVMLSMSGHGTADLGQLQTREADIRVFGNGRVTLSPRETANVTVSGSGVVAMATRPAHLSQHTSGAGSVRIGDDR